jgi:hypothetical protein
MDPSNKAYLTIQVLLACFDERRKEVAGCCLPASHRIASSHHRIASHRIASAASLIIV